jgi:hypothetical protein
MNEAERYRRVFSLTEEQQRELEGLEAEQMYSKAIELLNDNLAAGWPTTCHQCTDYDTEGCDC